MARRLAFFQHGVAEEFYDYEHDPETIEAIFCIELKDRWCRLARTSIPLEVDILGTHRLA